MEISNEQQNPLKQKKEKTGPGKKELTLERARLAQERTLLAWVRTATTFMTFGFALYKFLEVQMMQLEHTPLLDVISPRMIGVSMLLTGLLGLVLAVIRYFGAIKALNKFGRLNYFSPALLQAYLVTALILILLYGSLLV